jgi:hypothetical protein
VEQLAYEQSVAQQLVGEQLVDDGQLEYEQLEHGRPVPRVGQAERVSPAGRCWFPWATAKDGSESANIAAIEQASHGVSSLEC